MAEHVFLEYSPYINHFLQPDTIIPNPANPQAFNRFSYVGNNPVNFNDPSGHLGCKKSSANAAYVNVAEGDCTDLSLEEHYGITFSGVWTHENKQAVFAAAHLVGKAFANEIGGEAAEAFKTAYGLNDGDTLLFEWDENCWGCREDPQGCDAGTTTGYACESGFGYTNTANHIEFASLSTVEVPLRNVNNVIHELGHAFNIRLGRGPENALAVRLDLLVNGAGFYGDNDNRTWEASSGIDGSETFADQFLGWVSGKWGEDPLGPVRAEFMNQMNGANGWVAQAAGLP